ncbi:MAG: tetratricopeptide repeat protein [Chryseolinea sp.]
MKCCIAFIAGLLMSSFLHGQTPAKLDSLLAIAAHTPKGTGKIDLYEKICMNHIEVTSDLLLARKYADSIKLLSTEIKYRRGLFLATYYYGLISSFQGQYQQALDSLKPFSAYAKSEGDSTLLAKGLYHIALVNLNLGNFDKCLSLLYRTLAIEEKTHTVNKIAHIYNVIGSTYKRAEKLTDALGAYQKASLLFKGNRMLIDYGMSVQNKANIHLALKNYDSAKTSYEAALKIFTKFKNPVFIATVLGNMGNMYEAKNEYQTALQFHHKALAMWRTSTRKRSLAISLTNIGKSYTMLSNYGAAEESLKEALQVAKEVNSNSLLLDVYTEINKLYFGKRDFEKAYHYYGLASQMKDSIFTETRAKQLNEIMIKYEAEKKDQQITVLAKEKEVQLKEVEKQSTLNKAFAGGLIATLLFGGLIVYIFRQRSLLAEKNAQINEADFKSQVVQLEMKALRAQINPHFLFNCMNAINLMIRQNETENACRYLTKFSKLVRQILENAEAASVTLESEIALIESYIQLEELRLPGKIKYEISIDESIGIQNTYLPSMILQPVIENAIWHGIVHKGSNEPGVIKVDVRPQDDQLVCIIEDNGVGRDKAKELKDHSLLNNKSLGMKITEERLRLLSRRKMEKFIFITDLKDLFNNAMGTSVTLHIPIAEK